MIPNYKKSNTSKQIAIFVPDMVVGGAQRSILKLARGIVERGFRVDLVLSRKEGPFLDEIPDSVRLVNLNSPRVLMSLPSLVRYLRIEQPIAMLSVLHANLIALWARRIAGVPTRIIVSERNTLSVESQNLRTDLRMLLMPKLVSRFYPWADGIVAVSKGVAKDLVQVVGIDPERIQVIYNPIVTPEFKVKAKDPLDHPWFGEGQPPVILAVGRLEPQKDFTTLIRSFAQARQTHVSRLMILGEGADRPKLETMVKQLGLQNDICLPGIVSNPYPYMARADLFVLSSRWEGLPGVLIEALYCGVPLISTDCPSGPREILGNGLYGKLVPVGDVNALAQAMVSTLNGKVSRPPVESWHPYELDRVVNQFLQVLIEEKTLSS